MKFSLNFVKRLLDESDSLEIEIPTEYFDKHRLLTDMKSFQEWRIRTEMTLKYLEKELNQKQQEDQQSDRLSKITVEASK